MPERLDQWRQRLERVVVISYLAGMVLATAMYFAIQDRFVLEITITAGALGVLILLLLSVIETTYRRQLERAGFSRGSAAQRPVSGTVGPLHS